MDAAPPDDRGDYHDQVVQEHVEQFRDGGGACVRDVPLVFEGETARIDILCLNRHGILVGVAVKTGDDCAFTDPEKRVYGHAMLGFGVTSADPAIADLGAIANAPLPPIKLCLLHAPGRGLPYRAYSLGALHVAPA